MLTTYADVKVDGQVGTASKRVIRSLHQRLATTTSAVPTALVFFVVVVALGLAAAAVLSREPARPEPSITERPIQVADDGYVVVADLQGLPSRSVQHLVRLLPPHDDAGGDAADRARELRRRDG